MQSGTSRYRVRIILYCTPRRYMKRPISRNGRAVGVEYVNDTVMDPDADQTIHLVRASKLVVVSAGAFGSPTILERSGIGGQAILETNGVKQIVDLPGVGENYQGRSIIRPHLDLYRRDSP
jgi:alcohol oxidase